MPNATVVGSGPVTFTTTDGQQLSIPLSLLYFDSSNILKADRWPLYTKYKAEVDPWLHYLVTEGELTPGTTAAPLPAILIHAADPGQAGNNIQVTFSNITPDPSDPTNPTKTTFDAIVVETDAYSSLSFDPASPNFIKTVLGTQTTITGSQPGLVHVFDADHPSQPKAGIYQLTGGTSASKSTSTINSDPTGTAFNLEAKKNGMDGDKTSVTISNVDAVGKTFSLVAVWSSQPITGSKLADLPGKLAQSASSAGYEISVTAPASGFAIPATGVVGLTGGADPRTASTASATAYAS
jgi:hypothetical protein